MSESVAKKPIYRPEIDGLRAVSVLAIIVFHLNPQYLPGGFSAVEVFLVISGYLICRNITRDINRERFTLSAFYAGRVKRLYPTYLTVILACCVASWFVMTPDQLTFFASSLLASLFYLSNVNFWLEAGYFDIASELKPLLHTWTLSVEEQFYVFFPLLLVWVSSLRQQPWIVLGIVAALSFLANIYWISTMPSGVFFLIPFRAWELMVGALLALGVYPSGLNARLQQAIFLLGLAFIFGSLLFMDSTLAYPGYWALLPVFGTYMAIGAAPALQGGFALALLRSKPLVTAGLMSYALYLWHWPIIVFYKLIFDKAHLHWNEGLLLLPMLLLLSWVSTFIIEPPFRRGVIALPKLLKGAVIFTCLFIVFGVHVKMSAGAAYRYPELKKFERSFFARHKYIDGLEPQSCASVFSDAIHDVDCVRYGDGDEIDFVIWGDSHARELGLYLASNYDNSFVLISMPGCPPLLGVQKHAGVESDQFCNSGIRDTIERELMTLQPKLVVLVARWSFYHREWVKHGELQPPINYICDIDCTEPATPARSLAALQLSFQGTLETLATFANVLVLKTVPLLDMDGKDIVALPLAEKGDYIPSQDEHRLFQSDSNAIVDRYCDAPGCAVFDPSALLCETGQCVVANSEYLFYFDDNHLNVLGWATIGSELAASIQASGVHLQSKK